MGVKTASNLWLWKGDIFALGLVSSILSAFLSLISRLPLQQLPWPCKTKPCTQDRSACWARFLPSYHESSSQFRLVSTVCFLATCRWSQLWCSWVHDAHNSCMSCSWVCFADSSMALCSFPFNWTKDPIYKPHLHWKGHQPLMAAHGRDNEDEDESETESMHSPTPQPHPRSISATVTGVDAEADEGIDFATLLSLKPDLALGPYIFIFLSEHDSQPKPTANNNSMFNTDQFVYKHLDLNLLDVDLQDYPAYLPSSMFKQQRKTWEKVSSSSSLTPTKRPSLYSKMDSEMWKLTSVSDFPWDPVCLAHFPLFL